MGKKERNKQRPPRDFYSAYTKDELWLIRENKWSNSLQNIREAQFSLGNGYMGSRGILEEIPYNSQAGTYIAGLYDTMASQVAELVNLPNPINFKFTSQGQKFDLFAMDSLEHKRILNVKKGLLIRQTLYRDTKKRRYDYQSLRFLSMRNKYIGVMQIAFTPLDGPVILDINTGIDTSVFNAGVLSEGRKKHFRVKELGQAHKAGFLVIETLDKRQPLVYWSGFYYQSDGKPVYADDNIFQLKVPEGESVIFTKVFCIKRFPPSSGHEAYKKEAFKIFQKAFDTPFSVLLKEHIQAWERLWKKADILIEGTQNLQQNLRFNIYHMLICGHFDYGLSSVGARTLSGEGYRGHVFWDTELFLLPFYILVFPQMAKNILLYRFRRLNKARELAREAGYKGAKFPWESAYSGEEETPEWARDLDGSIIKIHTHKFEHHITSDIAYAVYKYYQFSGDEEFMTHCGYELIFESARFWASRITKDKLGRYHIRRVIGPDEFHIDVNNNAFTNMMARWNLDIAYRFFCDLRKKRPWLCRKLQASLDLKEKEARSWKGIASRILLKIDKKKVIEQFDGYFRLKKILPGQSDENGLPLFPARLKLKDIHRTQLIKQADVLMLFYLFSDLFDEKVRRANYSFYLPRTMHKSSLSPSVHALVACQVGDLHKAYSLFNVSLRTDISNLYDNTFEGIHAANLGGTWQAVVFGFAGVEVRKGRLSINPRMPRTWRKLVFSLIWRANLLRLELTNDTVRLKISAAKRRKYVLNIFGEPKVVSTKKSYIFKRKTSRYRIERYY